MKVTKREYLEIAKGLGWAFPLFPLILVTTTHHLGIFIWMGTYLSLIGLSLFGAHRKGGE